MSAEIGSSFFLSSVGTNPRGTGTGIRSTEAGYPTVRCAVFSTLLKFFRRQALEVVPELVVILRLLFTFEHSRYEVAFAGGSEEAGTSASRAAIEWHTSPWVTTAR